MTLTDLMARNAAAVGEMLDDLMVVHDYPEARLIKAMRYACMNGGKRVRPFLVRSAANLFGVDPTAALRAAAAVEMVHCYSLVHDDLPAMDDDDLRRGQPTCHIQYDEATAILAGDALLTKAFEIVGDVATHEDPGVRAELVLALAKASGDEGMVGGQMLDLMAAELTLSEAEVTRLQRMKTGALIAVSVDFGAILGRAHKPARTALQAYAHDLGLAFQIADDILDVEGSAEEVGKRTGKDEDAGKATFVTLLGLERAKEQAQVLADQAARHLEIFEEKAEPLRQLADFVVNRRA